MSKLPDDLAGSIVYVNTLPELTRQLENICESIVNAHNDQATSQEQLSTISTTPSVAIQKLRGVGILMVIPSTDGNPCLVAACCKSSNAADANISTLANQYGSDNRYYTVTWQAGNFLNISVNSGQNHQAKVLWIGS